MSFSKGVCNWCATVGIWAVRKSLKIWTRGRELTSRPADYESAALPLSYLGFGGDSYLSTLAKLVSIPRAEAVPELTNRAIPQCPQNPVSCSGEKRYCSWRGNRICSGAS